jgi:peptidoglycan hydrolase-like protein with peptidoglycan-binding domain
VVAPGRSLWSVDGAPVTLLQGAVTAWRTFAVGMSAGADVAALNQALISLDLAGTLTPPDAFTAATATAVKRLQASLGQPQTGTLPLGSVIFEPAAVRVTVVHPVIGSPVQGGAAVLDVTSTTPIVNVALPVDQTFLVKVGDAVTVTMPDGTTAKGAVTAVGSVATNTTPSSGAGSNTPSATVNLTVSLSNPSPTGSLDQAPVTVNITNASAPAALAVPVSALLALAGGGYAVEVVAPDGTHRLVGVTTGLFDDQAGLVQVTGTGLEVGQRIVVAA